MPSATQASASMRLRTRGFISLAASSRKATGSAFSWRGRGLHWPSHLASVGAKPSRLTSRSHVLTAPGRTCAERAASSIGRPESVISITSRRARTSGLTGPARAEAISRRVLPSARRSSAIWKPAPTVAEKGLQAGSMRSLQAPLDHCPGGVCGLRRFLDRFTVQDGIDHQQPLAHPAAFLIRKRSGNLVAADEQGIQVDGRVRQCLTNSGENGQHYTCHIKY